MSRANVYTMLRFRGYIVDETQKCATRGEEYMLLFFLQESKISADIQKKLLLKMQHCTQSLIVTPHPVDKAIRQKFTHTEWFLYSEFILNIASHPLVPPHRLLSLEEGRAILTRNALLASQLPILPLHDRMVRYLGGKEGDIIEIKRPDEAEPIHKIVTRKEL